VPERQQRQLIVRQKLQQGLLPRAGFSLALVDGGDGIVCDICGTRVLERETQCTVHWNRARTRRVMRVHAQCYALWESVLEEASTTSTARSL
jgi:hypothetical protein